MFKIGKKEFLKAIKDKSQRLLKENEKAITKGDKHTIQCNCNQLNGIAFVMSELRKIWGDKKS